MKKISYILSCLLTRKFWPLNKKNIGPKCTHFVFCGCQALYYHSWFWKYFLESSCASDFLRVWNPSAVGRHQAPPAESIRVRDWMIRPSLFLAKMFCNCWWGKRAQNVSLWKYTPQFVCLCTAVDAFRDSRKWIKIKCLKATWLSCFPSSLPARA